MGSNPQSQIHNLLDPDFASSSSSLALSVSVSSIMWHGQPTQQGIPAAEVIQPQTSDTSAVIAGQISEIKDSPSQSLAASAIPAAEASYQLQAQGAEPTKPSLQLGGLGVVIASALRMIPALSGHPHDTPTRDSVVPTATDRKIASDDVCPSPNQAPVSLPSFEIDVVNAAVSQVLENGISINVQLATNFGAPQMTATVVDAIQGESSGGLTILNAVEIQSIADNILTTPVILPGAWLTSSGAVDESVSPVTLLSKQIGVSASGRLDAIDRPMNAISPDRSESAVDDQTMSEFSVIPLPVITVAGQNAVIAAAGFAIGSQTFSPDGPAITVSGTVVSLGTFELYVGASTGDLHTPALIPSSVSNVEEPPLTTAATSIVTGGQNVPSSSFAEGESMNQIL